MSASKHPRKYALYTPALAQKICEQLATGLTLSAVCRLPDMPTRQAVNLWVLNDTDGFREKFLQARRMGYEIWADQILDLSDGVALSKEAVMKARLQVDTRKWLLAKTIPKIYGERVVVAGDAEAPLVVTDERIPLDAFLQRVAERQVGVAQVADETGGETRH